MVRVLPLIASLFVGLVFPTAAQERYFYHNLPYGSEALYNPISLVLNGSYDILQMENRSREFFDLPYAQGTANVFRNLASPFARVSEYGWCTVLRDSAPYASIRPRPLATSYATWCGCTSRCG